METHQIKFLLLNKHELSYEVLIRGEEPGPTVLKLRNQINKLTSLIPSDDIQESGLDAESDYEGAVISCKELASRVNQLHDKYDANLFERTKALANHIYYRLTRMDRTEIADKISRLQKAFNKDYNLLMEICQSSASQQTNSAMPDLPSTVQPATILTTNVDCSKHIIGDLQKLKYNGKSCVRVFLQRVKEFCTSRNIPTARLLECATEIFSGHALHWFRSVKDDVCTWDELAKLLIADFGKFDYDYRLMSEIRIRTQGDTENIVIYLAIMSELFSRLSQPISEAEKLEIILHNIRPCYTNIIAVHGANIDSIASLRTLARNFEQAQAMSAQFREPPKVNTATLAPDLAFTHEPSTSSASNYTPYSKSYPNRHNRFTSARSQPVAAISTNKPDGKRFCPRCRNDSHSLSQCRQEHYLICFKCGKKDVKYPDCTKCNPKFHKQSKN